MAALTDDFHDDDEVVDRNRIMRDRRRWAGLEELTNLAHIEVLEHGGITRPIITRGGKHLRSRLVSRKTDRVQITEGKGLKFACRTCEVDGRILYYQAHPFRVTAVADGRPIEWYPDLARIAIDGGVEIIEVKRTPSDLDDDEYRMKLGAFREIFRRCDWRMRILYNDDIFGPARIRGIRAATIGAVHSRRFLSLFRDEEDVLEELVGAGSPIDWATAASLLAPNDRRRGDAVVEHAIARGRFTVDFDQAFAAYTPLTPIAPVGAVGSIRI